MTLSRRALLAAAGSALLAGCSGGDGDGTVTPADPPSVPTSTPTTDEPPPPVETLELSLGADPVLVGGSARAEPPNAPPLADRQLPAPLEPAALFDRAVDGGVPKDGIPSIDEPTFRSPESVDHHPGIVVFGVARNGEAKAYPRGLIIHHEIVNDVVGGDPVSVTFCPLTGTALGFERGETTFGVSGNLINSNLIMYDRARERLWPQVLAHSIPGWGEIDRGPAVLQEFEVVRTTWGAWRAAHPDTVVLSEDTGYVRNYWIDPYGERGYYYDDDPAFPSLYSHDARHAKDWVYGVRTADGAVAFGKDALVAHGVIHGELGDTPVVAAWDQALETARVYRNPEGHRFAYDDGRVVGPDGSRSDPAALDLERLHSFDALWFAWVGLYPTSTIYHVPRESD